MTPLQPPVGPAVAGPAPRTKLDGHPLGLGVRIALAAALTLALMAAMVSDASALAVKSSRGRVLDYKSFVRITPPRSTAVGPGSSSAPTSSYECFGASCQQAERMQPLSNSNGEQFVMPTTTTYIVYWDPAGAPYPYQAGYQSGITRYFKGLAHDSGTDGNFYSVLTQYGVKYENHFGKALVDHDAYPAQTSGCEAAFASFCVTDQQVQAELGALVRSHKLPPEFQNAATWEAEPEPRIAYFVVLPPGVASCAGTVCSAGPGGKFCAYHSFILPDLEAWRNGTEPAGLAVYAVQPYTVEEAGCDSGQHPNGVSDAALDGGMVHEFAEMITDPNGLGWLNNLPGGGEEVADICQDGYWASGNAAFAEQMKYGTSLGTAPNGALYDQVVDKRDYYYQQMYSNETRGCRQRRALPPVVQRLAPAAGPLAGGTKVKITGLNFIDPTVTSVAFGASPAKSFKVTSPTSITAVSPAAATAGPVEVRITTSAGVSASVAADRFTYE